MAKKEEVPELAPALSEAERRLKELEEELAKRNAQLDQLKRNNVKVLKVVRREVSPGIFECHNEIEE